MKRKSNGPRGLIFDIETWPIIAKVWQVGGPQYVRHQRVVKDRAVASVAFKFTDEDKVHFYSTEGQRDLRNDKRIMKKLRKAILEADYLITQNGNSFDIPIVTGRFSVHKLGSIPKKKRYDTRRMADKMGLPSSSLEYLGKTYAPHLPKLTKREFPGDELWDECELGNKRAWAEMRRYNSRDVETTDAVFKAIAPYANIDFSVFVNNEHMLCSCGSTNVIRKGYVYTDTAKYQVYHCKDCGSWPRGRKNLIKKKGKKL